MQDPILHSRHDPWFFAPVDKETVRKSSSNDEIPIS